jgi:molybdopterin-guanine dinucleotide biosynthesis protein A
VSALVRVDGIVLAGGLSRRFGSDKRLALVEGEPLVARACRRMAQAVDGTVIIATGARALALPGTRRGIVVRDEPPGRGPLGGLAAALARCDFGAVVSAVDLPLVKAATLARLAAIGRLSGRPAAIRTSRGWEPLLAFYPRSVLHDVRAALSQGSLAAHALLERWSTIAVAPTDAGELANVNRRADLDPLGAATSPASAGSRSDRSRSSRRRSIG